MSFQNETLKVRPTKGIAPDVEPWEASDDFYSTSDNVSFRDGFADRSGGHGEVYVTPLAPPSYLLTLVDQGRNFWVYAGDSTVSVVEGSTHSDISFVGQSPVAFDNAWTGTVFNQLVVLNNGTDTPVFWDNNPINPMVELPGWPIGTVVKAMRSHKFYLFGLDVTDGSGQFPNRVMWSDSADPGTVPGSWTPAIDNDAGFVDLASGGGRIIDGLTLRDSFMLYRENSVWAADFIGGNAIFKFREIFKSNGILNRNCVVEFEGNHVFMTDNDIMLTDGFSVKSIADQRVRRFINESIDATNIANSFVARNIAKNEIWICFPFINATTCTQAAVWSHQDDAWSFRDLPGILHANNGIISDTTPSNLWDDAVGTWDTNIQTWNTQGFSFRADGLLMADFDATKLQLVDELNTFDGVPISATIRKNKMSFGEPDRFKQVKRIWPKIDAMSGTVINVQVGFTDSVNSTETFTTVVPFIAGVDNHIDIFANGRYLSFIFSSTTTNPWVLTGWDIEYRLGSYF